jgi:SAM-dependent methyltransferase
MNLRSLLTRAPLLEKDGVLDYIANSAEDYCANFGDQWNRFRLTQIDSLSGSTESRNRFFAETNWTPDGLSGKLILDGGCGAGRFAEIALECGASVIAVDVSEAAYACSRTLARFPRERYLVLRADLFDLPLTIASFDGVYSLGVLQHTPDPLDAIRRLSTFLRPGGRLATWIYERKSPCLRYLQPREWIRKLSAHWKPAASLRLARMLTAIFFPIGWLLSWFGRPGQLASYFLPYACRHHLARRSLKRQWDYCVMDTFDWYGPMFELPQAEADVLDAYRSAGLEDVRRTRARGMAIIGHASP